MNKCSHCRFWNEFTDHRLIADHLSNECRRHAPVIDLNTHGRTDVAFVTRWPITEGTDFCGEFQIHHAMEPCKGCGEHIAGPHHWPSHFKTELAASYMFPLCKKCHDQFVDGTHPYLKKDEVAA